MLMDEFHVMRFSSIVWKEEDMYVALCPELDIASQGETVEEALKNLKEAIELYLEDEDAKIPKETPLLTSIEVSLKKV